MKPKKQNLVNMFCGLSQALLVCAALPGLFLLPGCAPGIVAVFGTPTSSEMKVPAEYALAAQKDKKILVLVDQPYYLSAHPNLRYLVTNYVIELLQKRVKISPDLLIDYDKLAELRSSASDFSLLNPEQVGARLGADFVLSVSIINCQIRDIDQAGFYSGSLDAQAQLIQVSTGQRVWPAMEQTKTIQVGFESERHGPDAAAMRLAADAAHCITRHLYNCPKNQFKIADAKSDVGWEK
jgi:hypothetical protein